MQLSQVSHPSPAAKNKYDRLVGMEQNKEQLLTALELPFKREDFSTWCNTFHQRDLWLRYLIDEASPLILLSGDVGCGKTALAESVATPLSERLGGKKIMVLTVPSNVRGTGLVGELSSRIVEVFRQAREILKNKPGILLIDEGDDLATSREQLNAHHEDRAGVNALLKEIDNIGTQGIQLAVLLITNRAEALDPALVRRASLHLRFDRPKGEEALRGIWQRLLEGIDASSEAFELLVESCKHKSPPYSYSDLVHRVGYSALLRAFKENRALCVQDFQSSLEIISPTPVFQSQGSL